MNETYVECLVKSRTNVLVKLAKIVLIMLSVIFLLMFMVGMWIGFIALIVSGIGAYLAGMYSDVEYEYLYLDRELCIDRILGKSRRKRIATYSLDRIEILAPIKSWHLDNVKKRQCKTVDYSIKMEEKPDRRYVMYYEGNNKVILSPSPEMITAMRNVAPRKVFND